MLDIEISLRDSENRELARLKRNGYSGSFMGTCVIPGKAVQFVVLDRGEEWGPQNLEPHTWMTLGATMLFTFEKDSLLAGTYFVIGHGGGGGSGACVSTGGSGAAESSGLQEVDGKGYACRGGAYGGRNDSRPVQQAATEKSFDFDEYNSGIKRR